MPNDLTKIEEFIDSRYKLINEIKRLMEALEAPSESVKREAQREIVELLKQGVAYRRGLNKALARLSRSEDLVNEYHRALADYIALVDSDVEEDVLRKLFDVASREEGALRDNIELILRSLEEVKQLRTVAQKWFKDSGD
ncbi:MAG: hypothetical protein QXU97_01520 [Fervidicoccaceae archaeon]